MPHVCVARIAITITFEYIYMWKWSNWLTNEKNKQSMKTGGKQHSNTGTLTHTHTRSPAHESAHASSIPIKHFLRSITVKYNYIALGINSISPISWSRHWFAVQIARMIKNYVHTETYVACNRRNSCLQNETYHINERFNSNSSVSNSNFNWIRLLLLPMLCAYNKFNQIFAIGQWTSRAFSVFRLC